VSEMEGDAFSLWLLVSGPFVLVAARRSHVHVAFCERRSTLATKDCWHPFGGASPWDWDPVVALVPRTTTEEAVRNSRGWIDGRAGFS
jgi:hypothetical protein